MGHDVEIVSKKTRKTLWKRNVHHIRGANYPLGGSNEAHISITFNYWNHFVKVLGEEGIRTIYGMSSKQSIPLLTECIEKLEDSHSNSYWEPTEGNARKALISLRELARLYPDGIWAGD